MVGEAAGSWDLYPHCIFGLSRNDFYTGGNGIYHFSGSSWKEIFVPKVDSLIYRDVVITDIRGTSPDNIWAVGYGLRDENTSYGVIYHYNGKDWKQSTILKMKNINPLRIYPTGEGTKCLIFAVDDKYDTFPDGTKVFEYDGNSTLKEIASGSFWERENQTRIYAINGKLFVEMNNIIYEYYYGQYRKLIPIQRLNNGLIIGGRSKSDIGICQ